MKPSFKKLAPVPADIEAYRPAFDFVFAQDDLLNIALSGPHGSGKSSVMAAVMEDGAYGGEHRFLTVSLPSFEGTENDKAGDARTASSADLEGLVLNQLVHSMGNRRAPRSPFRKTAAPNMAHLVSVSFAITVFTAALLLLADFGGMASYVPDGTLPAIRFAAFACVLAGAFAAAFFLLRDQVLRKIVRKVKAGSYEIELFDPDKGSKFNAHMDGIIYLMNSADVDVIVFEDLDRHCNVAIFERLRQLNALTNRNRPPGKGPLRFFYLVRDDLFASAGDRTKFFDFIIPVVPYVDRGNSGDRLIADFKEAGVDVDPTLLYDVSLYIDDPRLLNNILNESQIIARRLYGDLGGLDRGVAERIVAMAIYKNVFPDDFAQLQCGRGYLHDVLASRDRLLEVLTSEMSGKAADLERRIQSNTHDLENAMRSLENVKQQIHDIGRFDFCDLLFMENGRYAEEVFSLEFCESGDPLWLQTVDDKAYNDFVARPEYEIARILVERGLIDHSYRQYIGAFHSGGITERDAEFMRAMADRAEFDPGFELDNPHAVARRTPLYRFGQGVARNYSLVGALVEMHSHEKLEMLLDAVAGDGDLAFVVGYALSGSFVPRFFNEAFGIWMYMVADVLGSQTEAQPDGEQSRCGNVGTARKAQFAWLVLEEGRLFLDLERNRAAMRDFVSETPSFLSEPPGEASRSEGALNALAGCGVQFASLQGGKHPSWKAPSCD